MAAVERFDDHQLRLLQAVGVFSVDDFLAVSLNDPDAVHNLLGDLDIGSLQADLLPRSPVMSLAGGLSPRAPTYHFGAATPSGLTVPDRIPATQAEATVARLAAGPEAVTADPDLPSAVNLSTGMRPIRDQGSRQTCVAHAGVAVLEHIEEHAPSADLSPQYLYWAAKQRDGQPTAKGTFIRVAMTALLEEGVCPEHDWPYEPRPIEGNEGHAPPPSKALASAADHKARQTYPVEPRSSKAISEQIDTGRPVAFSVQVYASSPLVRVWTNPAGKIPMPFPGTSRIGGHAMCAVGYQPDSTAPGGAHLIVRNSWGVGWASASPYGAGYGTIPFAYIDAHGLEAMTAA